jgi:hypothetical protein
VTTTRAPSAPALAAAVLVLLPFLAAAATPAASATPDAPGQAVKLADRRVAVLEAPLDGVSPAERARRATEAVSAAFAAGARKATVRPAGDHARVLLGDRVVLTLGPADAVAAGLPDAGAAGAAAAASLERAARDEDRRQAAQGAVFALSMLVFSGLVAFLLARRAGALALGWAEAIESGALALPGVTAGGVEVVSAGFVRAAVPLTLRLGRFVVWLAALYAWLLFSATLTERTRALGQRLGDAVLEPAAAALAALARGIPLALAVALAAAVVGVVLRAARLWFEALERGDTTSPWFGREHARTSGVLVRGGVVVLALLVAPGLLGLGERVLGDVGRAALLALGLGAAPFAASLLLGVVAVYGGALRPGDEAEVGGRRGRVVEVTLREVVLEDAQGALVRVSHLAALLHPTRLERRP